MPAQINELPKPLFSDLPAEFQAHYSQLIDTVNSLGGFNGTVPLANHLDLQGSRIMNIGAPENETDALSSGVAQGKYSVQALAPQLEGNAKTGLKSMRRINDTNQREQSSSWLNDLMSAVPSANELFPFLTNVGGNVQSQLNSTLYTWADGTTIQTIARTDLFTRPAEFTIATISSSGNLVTVVTTAPHGLSAGQAATIAGVTPSSFNGTFGITSVPNGTTFTYQLDLGTTSGSGGTVQVNGVWYYYLQKRDPTVHLSGPFPADSPQNRLSANLDGGKIVAVVVITNSGAQAEQSGGGGSALTGSPAGGCFF